MQASDIALRNAALALLRASTLSPTAGLDRCRGSVRSQRGFSMVEVLVTLLIVALALLGTAGLQSYAMRLNQGAQFRSQAVFLAADLAERMEANRPGAVDGAYVLAPVSAATFLGGGGAASTDCVAAGCTAAALAAFDLSQWQSMVATTLPQSAWEVVQTVSGNPSSYTLTISWVDRLSDTTQASYQAGASLGANAGGTGERFFYTATRSVGRR